VTNKANRQTTVGWASWKQVPGFNTLPKPPISLYPEYNAVVSLAASLALQYEYDHDGVATHLCSCL
jgi:hypothetical protein